MEAKVRDRDFLRAMKDLNGGELPSLAGHKTPKAKQRHYTRDNSPANLMEEALENVPEPDLEPVGSASGSENHSQLIIDDIKVEYHPSSGRQTEIHHFGDYKQSNSEPVPLDNTTPWWPFSSRLDFEFAELVHEAALNKKQIDRLIGLFHKSSEDNSQRLSFKSHSDVQASWHAASERLTPVF